MVAFGRIFSFSFWKNSLEFWLDLDFAEIFPPPGDVVEGRNGFQEEVEVVLPSDGYDIVVNPLNTLIPTTPTPVEEEPLRILSFRSYGKPKRLARSSTKKSAPVARAQTARRGRRSSARPSSSLSSSLAEILESSFEGRLFPCPKCEKSYKCRSSLDSHVGVFSLD